MAYDYNAQSLAAEAISAAQDVPRTLAYKRALTALPAALSVYSPAPTITINDGGNSSTLSSPVYWGFRNESGAFQFVGTPPIAGPGGLAGFTFASYGGVVSPSQFMTVQWMSDAATLEIQILNYNASFDIKVDGSPIQAATFSTTASGSQRLVKIDWSGDANPNKPRLYEIAGINLALGGVFAPSNSTLWYPSKGVGQKLMVFFGDSYTQGVGASMARQHIPYLIAKYLGVDEWHDGLGGSGWNSASPDDPLTRINKGINRLTRAPDFVVTMLGYNDGAGNMNNALANATAALTAVKAKWPQARIIMVGPWTPIGNTANLASVRTMLISAAAAVGATFIDIADIINAGNRQLYGSGDNVHPNQAGHGFLARRIAEALATVM